ncbi:MAG: hypothetical protein RLZZ242_106 [Bacteroidota bacterium]
MSIKHFLGAILLLSFAAIQAQQTPPIRLDDHPPLKIELRYSGTFSELRPNHFHGGVDLKTNGREGLPVYAVADGTIRRIKVATGGYGKVIYIDHGDTLSSVYGHLSQFSPRIQTYIKAEQYATQTYEIERYFSGDTFQVRAGEIIGYSGNTGNSFGPHLHFELREQKGQVPLNPLDFGLRAQDNDPPTLVGLYLYESDTSQVDHLKVNRRRIPLQRIKDSLANYFVSEPIEAAPFIGIGIEAFDRLEQSLNKNGLFTIALLANDTLITEVRFDRFSFENSPLINQVIDYEFEQQSNKDVQLLFKKTAHPLEMYKQTKNLGIIALDSLTTTLELILEDHSKNRTRAMIPIRRATRLPAMKKPHFSKAIDTTLISSVASLKLSAVEKSMISSAPLVIRFDRDTLHLSPEEGYLKTPILAQFKFSDSMIPQLTNQKLYFGKATKSKKLSFIAAINDIHFETRLQSSGKYGFAVDSVGPVIRAKNFSPGQNLTNFRYLTVSIEDAETSVTRYNGYIDDQWVLFEYEPKTKTLRCDLNDLILLEGTHTVLIEAEDAVKNRNSYKAQFEIR